MQFSEKHLIDTTPLPDSIPKVKELGASSAPLQSAAFFIGARCKDYNDDFMKCKTENPGKGEFECLKEGRRVTRCARSVYVLLALRNHVEQLRNGLRCVGLARDGHGHARRREDGQPDSCMPYSGAAC
ncbi:ndufa8, NADH-ubiquinone oxidoreductase complex I 19kd subunit [Diaporthe eres]